MMMMMTVQQSVERLAKETEVVGENPPQCLCGLELLIQRSGFDSQRYQIFLEVVGLERGPLSVVSPVEELTE
jgi:hypothetical protein